jgi:hypothetical protein
MKGQQRQLEEQRCELTFSAFLESSRAFFFFLFGGFAFSFVCEGVLLCKQQGPFVGLNLLSLKGWQPWSVVPTKSEKKCGCQQTKPK